MACVGISVFGFLKKIIVSLQIIKNDAMMRNMDYSDDTSLLSAIKAKQGVDC